MAKIPTELYVCVPRRSSRGAFLANIWANLTRKDTGEGLGSKKLLSYLDNINVSTQYTQQKTGYAGPFDINPKTVGIHKTYVEFLGDDTFEPCRSEEIMLEVNSSLLGTQITMQVSVVGVVGNIVKATGTVYEIALDGAKKTPAYSLPLVLMVFDATSTKRLQPVSAKMSNPDGTYAIEYTFSKLGIYGIFVNFFGDEKYISAWSNNGRTTTITVTGGGLPLKIEKTVTFTAKETKALQWLLSDTAPTAPDGYERFPDLDFNFGDFGKYWCFVKKP